MVAVKAGQAAAFLKTPEARFTAYLLFGTDQGLVSERAANLAKAISSHDSTPGEVIRLDEIDIENDPDRLSIELFTMPMFGGRKIVRVSTGKRINAAMLKPYAVAKDLAGVLIVEAGNLKRDDGMRLAFEKSANAAAIPCYIDDTRGLGDIIREILEQNRLTITPGARQLLMSRLGADRVMSRGEIEKLALYARDTGQISEDDVDAVVGDAAELTIDRIVMATASGDSPRAVRELSRALAAGENAQNIISAIQRYFVRLHRLRTSIDSGQSVDAAIGELRPAVHFKVKDALAAQCRAWRTEMLDVALGGIATAARNARVSSALEDMLTERLILSLSRLPAAGARSAR
jgi:DNA polymerase-3 subunit delta